MFLNDRSKWSFLHDIPKSDRLNPKIRALANVLSLAANGSARRYAELAMTVARDWIRQQTDTDRVGGEDIAGLTRIPGPDDAVEALERGTDDCDAKARLFVALCLAAGLRAEMIGYWRDRARVHKWRVSGGAPVPVGAEELFHVAASVDVGGGNLVPVELTLARARLGEWGEQVPLETLTKRWLET